ncbi:hypothetical protein Pcar_1706 [Syntrophotalea carbinolica DSM 2380]|uniref:DUF4186 domain-containing protein n=1 Tax=Syntrophotalea carbinolica (strain DSM 2380 / NBRC 103641 / GraBd1) TaxID=338963 RepID=Q3A3V8_SYNC1|nr:DUF4186 domain-containing protein [Syntrophotalea carbinolica]ABA88949.1 hypothetical protein Pcar_1706 [Syntrophotalea carbinolica DSM 2380]
MLSSEELFRRLKRSRFRSRFFLREQEMNYLQKKGLETILSHGRDFVHARLAPARPDNDGRQTPMRNHPFFVAQHATATCCRGCLEKWHAIACGRELTEQEVEYIVSVNGTWLRRQMLISAGRENA